MKNQIAEHILADSSADRPGGELILRYTARLLGIVGAVIVVTELLLKVSIGPQSLLMIYLLGVMAVSFATPSYSYGIIAALLCTFFFDYFITEPRLGFSITIGFPVTLFTMLAVTVIISTLINQVKVQAELATVRERRAEIFAEMNRQLISARSVDAILELAGQYLSEQLERPVVFYLHDPMQELEPPVLFLAPAYAGSGFDSERERHRVHLLFQSGGAHSVDFLEDFDERFHYEIITSRSDILGVIGTDCRGHPLSERARAALSVLTGQIALALDLQMMGDEQNQLVIKAEKEKMRSVLLRSISHDLRTPLTSIIGASDAILQEEELPEQTREELVGDIKRNAEWLIRMVENILTVTRISKETLAVIKTPEAAEEVVSHAVSIVRKRFPDCMIHVSVPGELLLVPMDATLISQVLINLLENAIKNSVEGAFVLLNVKRKEQWACFEVCDHGLGIAEDILDHLFEIHTMGEGQTADIFKGIGIGLSICQTIVQAHGGLIEGCNREEGGARFTFLLPLEKERTGGGHA